MVELFFFGVGEGSSRKAIESFAPRRFNIMINYASAVRPIPEQIRESLSRWISRLDNLAAAHSNQMTLMEVV